MRIWKERSWRTQRSYRGRSMKTRESQDHGGQDAVWFKIAFPTTRKLREGLVAIADETGVARSATYHLALTGKESRRPGLDRAAPLSGLPSG